MIDAERMLGSLVRSAMSGSDGFGRSRRHRGKRRRQRRGGMLGGAGKGALALGALGVAMAAYEHYAGKQTTTSRAAAGGPVPPPPPVPGGADPPPPPVPQSAAHGPAAAASDDALLLVRAMIAAANADHELDDDERSRILKALDEAEAGEEEKEFVRLEIESPVDLATLAAAATSIELASQIYLASCLAIEVDNRAERNYLDRLADRLGLTPERAGELEAMVGGEEEGETATER